MSGKKTLRKFILNLESRISNWQSLMTKIKRKKNRNKKLQYRRKWGKEGGIEKLRSYTWESWMDQLKLIVSPSRHSCNMSCRSIALVSHFFCRCFLWSSGQILMTDTFLDKKLLFLSDYNTTRWCERMTGRYWRGELRTSDIMFVECSWADLRELMFLRVCEV